MCWCCHVLSCVVTAPRQGSCARARTWRCTSSRRTGQCAAWLVGWCFVGWCLVHRGGVRVLKTARRLRVVPNEASLSISAGSAPATLWRWRHCRGKYLCCGACAVRRGGADGGRARARLRARGASAGRLQGGCEEDAEPSFARSPSIRTPGAQAMRCLPCPTPHATSRAMTYIVMATSLRARMVVQVWACNNHVTSPRQETSQPPCTRGGRRPPP
jgi:hypothetical protein